jgi:hypothetical protein
MLVVQACRLGTLPRKVPEVAARLTRFAATSDPPLHENSSLVAAKMRRRIAGGQVDHARLVVFGIAAVWSNSTGGP